MTHFKQKLARFAYSTLLLLVAPFYIIKLWLRGRQEPEYAKRIGERFGFYGASLPNLQHRGEYVWIHAVSLGEARVSQVLIDALREQMPHMKLLLTHGTATGWNQGKTLLQTGDVQCWLPVDMPGAIKRFFKHFQPRMGLLIETEMWPNLLYGAKQHHVAMLLLNARLSERSLKRALKVSVILRPSYESLTAALAQSDEDAQRLKMIGVPQVEVLGNMKYDMQPDAKLLEKGRQWKTHSPRPIIMAASTREGEEELLLQAWQNMSWPMKEEKQPILLIVPRHPQRFQTVADMIERMSFKLSKRSTWEKNGFSPDALQANIWLGDSLQEMVMYYGLSDIVLLGGSFKKYGGQNLLEALSCGCPVIFGEHTYNFALPSTLALEAGVAYRAKASGFDDALAQSQAWLQAPKKLTQLKNDSHTFIQQNQGTAIKTALYISSLCQYTDAQKLKKPLI